MAKDWSPFDEEEPILLHASEVDDSEGVVLEVVADAPSVPERNWFQLSIWEMLLITTALAFCFLPMTLFGTVAALPCIWVMLLTVTLTIRKYAFAWPFFILSVILSTFLYGMFFTM